MWNKTQVQYLSIFRKHPTAFNQVLPSLFTKEDPEPHREDGSEEAQCIDEEKSARAEQSSLIRRTSSKKSVTAFPLISEINLANAFGSLMVHFTQTKALKNPIELYEAELYLICRSWRVHLANTRLRIDSVKQLHHLLRIKDSESELIETELPDTHIDSLLTEWPDAGAQYKLWTQILNLTANLAVKYSIVHPHNFSYRTSERVLTVRILDMEQLNASIFSVETLWFASMTGTSPLSEICDILAKQYASVLLESAETLANFLVKLNHTCNFDAVPSIEGLLATRSRKLVRNGGIKPDPSVPIVPYQRLSLKRSFLCSCFRSDEAKVTDQIETLISEFTHAFLTFEKQLIKCFLQSTRPAES